MAEIQMEQAAVVSAEEIQQGWLALVARVGKLEVEKSVLERDLKELRLLLERFIDHQQKSQTELVLHLTNIVSKLPLSDVGVLVAKLVEHNSNLNEFYASLGKGPTGAMAVPEVLKSLDQAKRDLTTALKPALEELLQSDPPLDQEMLRSLLQQPGLFLSPAVARANRCFVKGYLPRERILKEFGADAMVFFNDMTTDPKRNPRPKPEEIVLGFKPEFEALLQQNPALLPDKRQELLALYQRVHRSKASTDQARAQRNAFMRISFIIELLHFYQHQDTEAPEPIFAHRLPGLVEQLVLGGPQESIEEQTLAPAESLLGLVARTDHRLMIINNVGKGGGEGRTLKFVLRLRVDKLPEGDTDEAIPEFVKHLVPEASVPPRSLAKVLRLISPALQRRVVKTILGYDRLRKDQAEALTKAVAEELGIKGVLEEAKAEALPPEMERQQAWARIKDVIGRRGDPASAAAAIRDRLHAKYDSDEVRQSWITLIESDTMALIRIFCQLPYLANGKTDPIARTVMEAYATRLTHEKYAATYQKVVNSLRNMFAAKADSPTLLNFTTLLKWANPEAAAKICADIGMPLP